MFTSAQNTERQQSRHTTTRLALFGPHGGFLRVFGRKTSPGASNAIVLSTHPIENTNNASSLPDFDIALIDIDSGLTSAEARIRIMCERYPDRPVVGVTEIDAITPICHAVEAGATGVLHFADLNIAQHDFHSLTVSDTRASLSPRVAKLLLNAFQKDNTAALSSATAAWRQSGNKDAVNKFALSARECEILRLSANGLVGREIAGSLSVSPHTITSHFKNIYRKLEVNTRGEAVFKAHCAGLI